MYPVVLGTPPPGPLPVRNDWRGLSIVWEGPNGDSWDLTDVDGGVVLSSGNVDGMHNPRITKYSSTARAVPGKRSRGWRAESREVFWPVYVWADGSDAWIERQRAFFDSIHPSKAGVWRVKAGDEERTLRLTGVFEDTHQYDTDPMLQGWSVYGITLEADQPFWEGEVIRRGPWGSPDPKPFIPAGGAPSFTISSSTAFGSASIPNPGDVEGWGVWTVEGPLSEVTLGVSGSNITIPGALEDGDVLVIDTDPRHPSATLNGADVSDVLGLQKYEPVPPGESVPLHVEGTGTGRITFDLVPLFFRAF